MPIDDLDQPVDWDRISAARARVLHQLALQRTEREGAVALGISTNGFKSQVRDLKVITGRTSVRELGAWWAEANGDWVRCLASAAGYEMPPKVHD